MFHGNAGNEVGQFGNMKNMCTTDWQVGKIDRLHNLHVTNMSTCDFTNINTFENKPCHHIFFQLRIW